MNYIGSKHSLLGEIGRVLDEGGVPPEGLAIDLFAGTGTVARFLKARGHTVYANDWQCYSYLTNLALVERSDTPRFERLLGDGCWGPRIARAGDHAAERTLPQDGGAAAGSRGGAHPSRAVLGYLEHLQGVRGPFYEAYCEGGASGRLYYSAHNGLRVQAIRDTIAAWEAEGLLADSEAAWLVACLLEAADRVANTASVYGAHLKHVKRSARRALRLLPLAPPCSAPGADGHRAFCLDAREFLRRVEGEAATLVYIDPPYNARQYNANYHILETLARWDMGAFVPRGVTGLRPAGEQRSTYCVRGAAPQAFDELLGCVRARQILFSYNNEGLLTPDQLSSLFARHCTDVHFHEVDYHRFRADVDRENRVYKGDATREFLILGTLAPR